MQTNLVIATRSYFLDLDSEFPTVTVAIGRPVPNDSGHFECAYTFSGVIDRTRTASGVDEIHALICALAMAGTDLSVLNERYDGKLQWVAGSANSSLPTIQDHWPFKQLDEEVGKAEQP